MEIHFNFHQKYCVGCNSCVIACINEKELDIDEVLPFRKTFTTESSRGNKVKIKYYSTGCMHCQDPICVKVCPKKCFTIDAHTKLVQLDSENCVGCKKCSASCEFKAIQFIAADKAAKCDGCLERILLGQLPACVKACPRKAITINEKNEVLKNGCESLRKVVRKQKNI